MSIRKRTKDERKSLKDREKEDKALKRHRQLEKSKKAFFNFEGFKKKKR